MNDEPTLLAATAEEVLSCYISSIPPEILSKILILCHDTWEDGRLWWQPARWAHNIPIYLTQICSSWRLLALDTPEFWSFVKLTFNEQSARNTGAITEIADRWLAKGRKGELALHIYMGFSFDDENQTDMAPIGQLLAARASDLQKFTLANCPENVTDYVTARMAENSFPSLEEVELHAYSSIWRTRFDALVSAPRLHTVRFQTWRTPSAHHDLTLLHLPWSQLRSFSISSASVSGHECLGILSHCAELTNLEVWVTSTMEFPSSAVILPKLSRLRLVSTVDLWGPSRSDIGRFLDVLRLPALHDLELCFIGRDPWSPLVSRFWERHSAQLRAFSLSNLNFRADLHLFFRTMPDLTSLTLSPREIRLAAPDFDALRVEQLLPALTHLDVAVGCAPGIVALESIRSAIAFVEARAAESAENGVARLQRVKFADWTARDEVGRDLPSVDPVTMGVELNRLRELKTHGMHVQWQVQGYDMLVPPDDDEPRYGPMATSSRRNSGAGMM